VVFFSLFALTAVFAGPAAPVLGQPVYTAMSTLAAAGQLGTITPAAIWGATTSITSYYILVDPTMHFNAYTSIVTGVDQITVTKRSLILGWIIAIVGIVVAGVNYAM
jgi:hypothetical protein